MAKKGDRMEAPPESLAEFNDYLRFLKEEGESVPSDLKQLQNEYLNFIYFSEVLRNSGLAEQTRWMAICRVAERMGCDPNNEDDRMLMLGVLAHKEFASFPKIIGRQGRPKGSGKWTPERDNKFRREVYEELPSNKPPNWGRIGKKIGPRYGLSPSSVERYWRSKKS
jgi:hypothetical protein